MLQKYSAVQNKFDIAEFFKNHKFLRLCNKNLNFLQFLFLLIETFPAFCVFYTMSGVTKMESTLFVPENLFLRKFKMFESAAPGGCLVLKEIALLNLFCFCWPKCP